MSRKALKFINVFYCIAAIMSIVSCTTTKETGEKDSPLDEIPIISDIRKSMKIKELIKTAEKYEEMKLFKYALWAWKDVRALDPDNEKAKLKINQLEDEMEKTIQKHLQMGKIYFQKKERKKARMEFLAVLSLDPDHKEAKHYLEEISKEKHYLHTVKKGDTLSKLAEMYYGDLLKYKEIAEFNNFDDNIIIFVGQKIKIPSVEGLKALRKEKNKKNASTSPAMPTLEKDDKKEEGIGTEEIKENNVGFVDEQKVAILDESSFKEIFSKAKKLFQKDKFLEAIKGFNKIVQYESNNPYALEYIATSKKIISHFEKGNELYTSMQYGMAYDEFNKVLILKPDSTIANDKINNLLPSMNAEAKYLLNDEQSPCEAIPLIEKILKRDPGNRTAMKLLQEAITLEKVLELQCK